MHVRKKELRENNIWVKEGTVAATNMDSELRKDLPLELTLRFMSASVRGNNNKPLQQDTFSKRRINKTANSWQDGRLELGATAQQQISEGQRT